MKVLSSFGFSRMCLLQQSNAMAALAGMVRKHLDRPLIYYTKGNIPQWLREQPVGNFKTAVDLGVEVRRG